VQKYLISFLDDASRFIVGWRILVRKKAAATALCLQSTLLKTKPVKPFVLWSDNGTEFQGVFKRFLRSERIRHRKTKPHNPQQNGKIERFWRNIKKPKNERHISFMIRQYNQRPHSGLPMIRIGTRNVHMTPEARYTSLPSWEEGIQSWIKDGIEYPFTGEEIPDWKELDEEEISLTQKTTLTLKQGETKSIIFPEPVNQFSATIMKATLKEAVSNDTEVLVRHMDMIENGSNQMRTDIVAIIKSGKKKAEEFCFIFEDGDNAAFSVNGQGVVTLKIEFQEEDDADIEEEEEDAEDKDWNEEEEDWYEEEEDQDEQEEE
jgi:hypothetical protein